MLARARQFFAAGAQPTERDFGLGRQWLPEPLFALFAAQHPRDVVHAAATARWLLERGHRDADLVIAALVHDIGKGEQRRLDRVAWVVAEWVHAGRLAHGSSRLELRRAMARSAAHATTGAAAMRVAGATPRAIELVARHHDRRATDPVLALLQEADAAN